MKDSRESIKSRGTKDFRAPEIKAESCTNAVAADVYSAAIILFYFFFGIQPFSEDTKVCGHDLWTLTSTDISKFWRVHSELSSDYEVSADFMRLFNSMIKADPRERATIAQIKSSKWCKGETYSKEEMASIIKRNCADLLK
mmetsp:Transcript_140381/g.199013  ORF Transcript_140381/g.199013 Transcript_140381/m.199013 type:complete len:141 (-) Transcript_140381:156-578(-)